MRKINALSGLRCSVMVRDYHRRRGGAAMFLTDRVRRLNKDSPLRIAIYELVDGTVVEKSPGWEESAIAVLIGDFLVAFAVPRRLGTVLGADSMLRPLSPAWSVFPTSRSWRGAKRYLLDTGITADFSNCRRGIGGRVDAARTRGDRVGTCWPLIG
jgi:hypothetical protein